MYIQISVSFFLSLKILPTIVYSEKLFERTRRINIRLNSKIHKRVQNVSSSSLSLITNATSRELEFLFPNNSRATMEEKAIKFRKSEFEISGRVENYYQDRVRETRKVLTRGTSVEKHEFFHEQPRHEN